MKGLLLFFSLILSVMPTYTLAQEKPNFLVIIVDDLNDWIEPLKGHPQTLTPNLNKLASQGIVFSQAYCQAPICAPSRAALFSGMYPSKTGNYLQIPDKDLKKSNAVSAASVMLPDYMEKFGYQTLGVGKLFHNGDDAKVFDLFGGWSGKYGPSPKDRMNYDPFWYGKPTGTSTDWGAFPQKDEEMPDVFSAEWAINQLNKTQDKPFFLAVGLVRPHVPWYVPQKWYDIFPKNNLSLPPYLPNDMDDIPPLGIQISSAPMMPTTKELLEQGRWNEVIQAYLACVHFADAQIGKILDALNNSKYAGNTHIILLSDHGYHLGEKDRFAKQALWKKAIQSVLIIKTAANTSAGKKCDAPVQLVDIYPTILDLADIAQNKENDGHSLLPLIQQPQSKKWPHPALTFYGPNNVSVVKDNHQLIQYEDKSQELYDLIKDPNEWNNLVFKKENNAKAKNLAKYIPQKQASISPYLKYDINAYFRALLE
jgi:arylsulfatase A-like enzyme